MGLRGRALTVVCAGLLVGGCATDITSGTYVRKSVEQYPVPEVGTERRMILLDLELGDREIPENPAERRKFLIQNLVPLLDARPELVDQVKVGHARLIDSKESWTFDRGSNRGLRQPASQFRDERLLDVVVHVDWRQAYPLYRVILEPINFKVDELLDLQPIVAVRTTGATLYAPLPSREEAAAQGSPSPDSPRPRLTTAWVSCERCLFKPGEDRALSAYDGKRRLGLEPFQVEAVHFKTRHSNLTAFDEVRIRSLRTGELARAEAAKISRQVLAFYDRRRAAHDANASYQTFVRETYQPLTLAAHAEKVGCPAKYASYFPYGNEASSHLADARDAEGYARCHQDAARSYDSRGYLEAYPGLVERERALFERTVGVERESIETLEEQLSAAESRIRAAFDNARRSRARAGRIAESSARHDRQAAALRASMAQLAAETAALRREINQRAGLVPDPSTGQLVTYDALQQRMGERKAGGTASPVSRGVAAEEARPSAGSVRQSRSQTRHSSGSAYSSSASTGGIDASDDGREPLVQEVYYLATPGSGTRKVRKDCNVLSTLSGDFRRVTCSFDELRHYVFIQSYCDELGAPGGIANGIRWASPYTITKVVGLTQQQVAEAKTEAQGSKHYYFGTPKRRVLNDLDEEITGRDGGTGRQRYFLSLRTADQVSANAGCSELVLPDRDKPKPTS